MDRKTDGEDATPDFMTAAEVAAWLRVGLSTIYAWTASGRIPCVKFNGVVRFQRNQLNGWMQQHTICPTASSRNLSERVSEACPRPLTHRTMGEAAARVKKRIFSTEKPIHHGRGH
jgi:excisionase family DNA binding protein